MLNQINFIILESITFVIGGFIIGFLFEIIIFTRFRHVVKKTRWKGFDILINALSGMPIIWFSVLGIYIALINLKLDPNLS